MDRSPILVPLLALLAGSQVAHANTRDTFGYSVTSQPFSFVDLSDNGTSTFVNFAGGDDPSMFVPLGFGFDFYDGRYTEVGVSPNGLLTFGQTTGDWTNTSFATNNELGSTPAIAPLWDDWQFFSSPFANGVLYDTFGTTGDQRLVVQWDDAFGYSSSPLSVTFQAILYERTGDIRFNYLDVNSANSRAFGAESTIGIRDADAPSNGRFIEVAYDEEFAVNNFESLLFKQNPADFEFGIGRNGDLALTNLSPAGVQIESITIDLTSAENGTFFDTLSRDPGFDSDAFAVETVLGDLGVVLPSDVATDGSSVATLGFEGFDPDELVLIGFDLDSRSEDGVLEGVSSPAGGLVTVTFSNNRVITREIFDMPFAIGGQAFDFATAPLVAAIPEPTTVCLLVGAFAGALGGRKQEASFLP